jgi:hypothetical protein
VERCGMSDPSLRQRLVDHMILLVESVDGVRGVRYTLPQTDLIRHEVQGENLPMAYVYDGPEAEQFDGTQAVGLFLNRLQISVDILFKFTHRDEHDSLLRQGNEWLAELLRVVMEAAKQGEWNGVRKGPAMPVSADVNEMLEPITDVGIVSTVWEIPYHMPWATPAIQDTP